MRIFSVLIIATMCLGFMAFADGSKVQDCSKLWQLEKEAGCPAAPSDSGLTTPPWKRDYWFVKKDFGPSKCVTDDNTDHEVGLLETRCDKWVQDRKNELKSKFLTSSCNQDCKPCAKNETLQRCTMNGEVHYKVSNTDAN